MTTRKRLFAGFVTASALAFAGASQAATISQFGTAILGNSGPGNYGQAILVDDNLLTENVLTAFAVNKGASGGGATTGYVDVYTTGSANLAALNFSSGAEMGNLNYLGSSTNTINTFTAGNNASLDWTFDNIILPYDTPVFLVLSNGIKGSGAGTSLKVQGLTADQVHVNITAADSHTLAFGGVYSTAQGQQTDNEYSVTLVPEPGSLALLGLGGLLIARRRRG